jgi:uncharacterized protein YndB with AHSA1/START domain
MVEFDDSTTTTGPPEEVWKALYDPTRFTEWWAGIETVEPGGDERGGDFTLYPEGYPDFPMPQQLRVEEGSRRVTISCLVSDIETIWGLAPRDDGGTEISVHVRIPEKEAFRLDDEKVQMSESLKRLAALAAR